MLSERIYQLRRRRGLSQEQLAEKLGVSRQTVSKWEGGQSTPELEKLRALCACFQVTLDQLTGEGELEPEQSAEPSGAPAGSRTGVALCLLGAVGLLLFGVLVLAAPEASQRLNESSAVTLNGSGILMAVFVVCMLAGLALIFWKK